MNLLISLRGLRSFNYGFMNTALGFYLKALGYSTLAVGIVVTAAGFFSAFLIILSGVLADRIGSRKLFLVVSSGFMALLGLIYLFETSFPFLLAGALIGGAGSAGGGGPGGGPFGPAQQAMLADKVEDSRRHEIFSYNALIGTVLFSFGALLAGLPDFSEKLSLTPLQVYKLLFLTFFLIGVLSLLISVALKEERLAVSMEKRSGKLIGKFTITAVLNGFGMGLIPLSLITLWFSLTYRVSQFLISVMVWGSNVTSSLSYLLAPSLARLLGTVRMIVVTRVIGVSLLFSLPFIPFFSLASLLYVVRGAFVSIGMPIRQSYMMGVVERDQRSTAVGISSGVGWGLPYAVSPAISGYVMQEISSSLPIFASAAFQFANSAVYWLFFRNLPPPEELQGRGGE